MSLDCEVVLTRSGARAMRDRVSGEVMHPVVGPLVESSRLYLGPSRLEHRLSEPGTEPIVLFDVGLGAGSNAALAFQLAESLAGGARRLVIESFDHTTAALELALDPEHAPAFGLTGRALVAARELVQTGSHASSRTSWRFHQGNVLSTLVALHGTLADVVFWDPFSPRNAPELWSLGAFGLLRRVCRERATVHTYSGSTRVRSALLLAGFCVGVGELIAPGKHATCAAVALGDLAQPLDRRWLERLRRSSSAFPDDAPLDALERVRALPQFG